MVPVDDDPLGVEALVSPIVLLFAYSSRAVSMGAMRDAIVGFRRSSKSERGQMPASKDVCRVCGMTCSRSSRRR